LAITNGYATLVEVKAALRITDSVDDSLLDMAVESASRLIDGYAGRQFYSSGTATRYFVAYDDFNVEVDDLANGTVTITTAQDADGVFDTTWGTDDYQLEPLNGVTGGIDSPYTRIRAVGDYLFPVWAVTGTYTNFAPVQIVGVFGWSAVPVAVKQAAILLAMRQFKRYDSPLGVAGFGDIGVMRVGRVDPDVEALLMPFKKVVAA